jgi:deoxyguanosine kinase
LSDGTNNVRIEVCGGIASGKTTIGAACEEVGLAVRHERFDENPFFEKFYADPEAYAFEAELTYLLQHFSQIREASTCARAVFDFSLVLDLAYALVSLPTADQRTFEQLLDRVIEKIGLPTLIVRLNCPSSTELVRIHERDRPAERKISAAFLESIDNELERALASRWFADVPVLRIDSGALDFRLGGRDRGFVLKRVLEMTKPPR